MSDPHRHDPPAPPPAPASTPPLDPPAAVLDAVCCVQFCAANKHGLLLEILKRRNWEILVPAEVSKEVLGKKGKYSTVENPWRRFIANDRVRVLDAITLDRADQAEVRATVARLRGTTAALALNKSKDLGEHLVVAHGLALRDAGRQVFVLIDEDAGQRMADAEHLPFVDMELLLLLGHRLAIPDLDTKKKVETVYKALRPFGASLVPWPASRLIGEL